MSIDTVVRDFFVSMQTPLSNQIFNIITISVYILLILGGIYLVYKKDKSNLTKYVIGGLILWGIIELLKIFMGRMRPDLSDNESFPGRHAGLSFFVAGFLPIDKKFKILIYIWAILIAVSRLALNLHWLSDVIVGSAIGWAFAYLINKIKIKALAERFRLGPAKLF